VPWTAGADDEAAADEDEAADDDEPEEAAPGDDLDVAVAEPEVPGSACEPGLVAGPGTIAAAGLADGTSPLPPAPGPREGAPRLLVAVRGPALPRAPATGA
jgi:hypothetical protein